MALALALFAVIWSVTRDDEVEAPPAATGEVDVVAADGPAFTAANAALSRITEVPVYQITGPELDEDQDGTYFATGAARVGDSDPASGDDTVIDCRLVRNPDQKLVDGRSIRLFDNPIAAEQQTIAMNGVIELSEGQRIDMTCSQEGGTGNLEGSVDSARLTYVRVAP